MNALQKKKYDLPVVDSDSFPCLFDGGIQPAVHTLKPYNGLPLQQIMSDNTFKMLAQFIKDTLGIKLNDGKKAMLQSRILKRLRILDIPSFEAYCNYLFSPNGMKNELQHLMNAVTTNKTDFFREPRHFDFLIQHSLPDLIKKHGTGVDYVAKIWSAGCSNGKEVYTLAMVLSEFAGSMPNFKFYIIGTDISTQVLEQAAGGIYDEDDVKAIPLQLKKKYLLKSKDRTKKLVRVTPEIRSKTTFKRLNLMDSSYNMPDNIDIIFCRNVFIYFDRNTQQTVLDRLCRKLIAGGYFFSGHSEGLNGFNPSLSPVVHAVFKKTAD